MAYQQLFALLRAKFGTLILFGLLFGAIGFFGLMVTEKRFQSRMDFLVVQTNVANLDFYTQFKSSEYLGNILAEALYSERFVNAVVETKKVNPEFLPFNKKDKLKAWNEMVSVSKNLQLGIISVTVKSNSEKDAAKVTEGIAEVLTTRNALFRGGEEKSVEIRVLSGPIVDENPTAGKMLQVTLGAFLAGMLMTAFVILVKAESQRSREMEFFDTNLPLNEMTV